MVCCGKGCLLLSTALVSGLDSRVHSLVAVPDFQPIHLAFNLSLTGGKQQSIFDCFPIRGRPRIRVKFYHEDLASDRVLHVSWAYLKLWNAGGTVSAFIFEVAR